MDVRSIEFPQLDPKAQANANNNIGLLMDVKMEMTVELGRTRMPVKDVLTLGEGSIIELDALAGDPVTILVNNKAIARGEVVVIDECFGVRITEILAPGERLN
jgi:flagellar motor switch protein FliN/FliY